MTHANLKVGDKVFYVETLPNAPMRRVPARVWYKRHRRKTGELWAIDLQFPRGILKEVPVDYIVLLSAVEQLGDIARS